MVRSLDSAPVPGTKGRVLHAAALYDLVAWVYLLGRERAFRERTLDLARLAPGESVLDVGCGTGTLALAAKARVGPGGTVRGIDPSPAMIARAGAKAGKAGLDVAFRTAVIEALPFPDAAFDLVLSTLMLHHLPRPARATGAGEIARVLKPDGRVLAVDFAQGTGNGRGLLARIHRHGHVDIRDVAEVFQHAGLHPVESGAVGFRGLQFVLAAAREAA